MVKMSEEKIEEIIYRLQKEIVEKFHIKENIKEDIQQEIAVYILERKEHYIKSNIQYFLIKANTVHFIKSYIERTSSNEISLEECPEIYSIYLESKLAKKAISDLVRNITEHDVEFPMTPMQKSMVKMRYIEQLTLKCIAREFNISDEYVRIIISKGLYKFSNNQESPAYKLLYTYLKMLDEY